MSGVNKHSALTDSTLHVAKGHADGITSMIPYKSGSSTQAFALIETISAGTFRPCLDIADSTVAPPTEVDGDIYLLDSSGTPHADWDSSSQEDWVYYDGTNDTWISVTPVEGTYCHDQDTGNLYCFDGTNWAAYTASASAGGSTTQVQFNDAGGLAGNSAFYWNDTSEILTIGDTSSADQRRLVLDASASQVAAMIQIKVNGVEKAAVSADGSIDTEGSIDFDGQAYQPNVTTETPSGTTETIDFNNGNLQIIDLESATGDVTLTLSNPQITTYILKVIQDSASAVDLIWPAAVLWPGGTAPVISTGADAEDIITLVYDGTNYYGNFGQDYS